MLGLVHNQPVIATPAPSPTNNIRMEVAGPDSKGRGRIYVKLDGQNLDFGVQFYKMTKGSKAIIDPRSGHFVVNAGEPTTFRAIVMGEHRDFEVSVP